MLSRRSLLLLTSLPLLLTGLTLQCVPEHSITSPARGALLAVDGVAAVVLDFGAALPAGSNVRVLLLPEPIGGGGAVLDVTASFLPGGAVDFSGESGASADLSPVDGIRFGRNALVLEIDPPGRAPASSASTLFSWLPDLNGLELERCDPIEPSECLYPFPNDHFTRPDNTDTGRRVNLMRASLPINTASNRVDPTEWNRNDGFSPGPMILTRIPGVDLQQTGAAPITNLRSSLDADAPFVLIHAASGERQLFFAELDTQALPLSTQSTILRPGKNLQKGERYIVALRRVRDANGDLLPPSPAFHLYRDQVPTFVDPIEARRPAMERIFADLERAGIARDDLYAAWDFTVISKRNLSERLIQIRDDAFASLAGEAPAFEVTSVSDQHDAKILRRVFGTVEVPLYLTNDGLPGARLHYDVADPVDELPTRVAADATYSANFLCVIPRSASADGTLADQAARIALYGHGLLGSHGETGASHVADMANEHNIVFCGTDSIGMAEDDADFDNPPPWVGNILADFTLFPTLADRLHQGILNTLVLGRLMKHPDGLANHPLFRGSEDDTPFLDTRHLFYDGNSQGGILGGAIAAVSQDLRRAVLGVPGMNYSTLLRRSVDFDDFLLLLSFTYAQRDHSLLISLAQMLWDRVETSGHVAHIRSDTYPNTPPKEVLLQVAFGDFQVSNYSAEVEARSLGASIHLPALPDDRHWEAEPFFGIPQIEYPSSGSALVYWDSGNLTPPNTNQPPRVGGPNLGPCAAGRGGDPHECPRREPSARLQKSEFLRQDVDENGDNQPDRDGQIINVCGEDAGGAPLACLAPGT